MTARRRWIMLGAAALAVLLVIGYQRSSAPPPASQGAPNATLEKVTIATNRSTFSTLLWVAEAQGYFREQGLDVSLEIHASGIMTLKSILAAQSDFAVCAEYPFAHKVLSGERSLRILGAIASGFSQELIATRESGIARPQDLKGKRVGVPFGTAAEFFLSWFLTQQGFGQEDVQVVNVASLDVAEALKAGRLDAVMIWEPMASEIKKSQTPNVVAWPGQSSFTMYWVLVCTEPTLQKRPLLAAKVLRALAAAEGFVKANPEASRRLVAERLGLGKDSVRELASKEEYGLALEQMLFVLMEEESRWLMRKMPAAQTTMPNYLNYVHTKPLREAAPGAVRAVVRD